MAQADPSYFLKPCTVAMRSEAALVRTMTTCLKTRETTKEAVQVREPWVSSEEEDPKPVPGKNHQNSKFSKHSVSTKGIVTGYGLKEGTIASSWKCQLHYDGCSGMGIRMH